MSKDILLESYIKNQILDCKAKIDRSQYQISNNKVVPDSYLTSLNMIIEKEKGKIEGLQMVLLQLNKL